MKLIAAIFLIGTGNSSLFEARVSSFQVNFPRDIISTGARRSENNQLLLSRQKSDEEDGKNNIWSGIVGLWDEVIEMSTYGPSERKMLKLQRERQARGKERGGRTSADDSDGEPSLEAFKFDDDKEWLDAFSAAKDSEGDADKTLEYDGYNLQDLLLSKWGVPLDLDFQKMNNAIYCTVLPIRGYGSPLQSRHENELSYLMHLQGVVEVLDKYNQLDDFIAFVETTNKTPKRGTDSVPYRLNLSEEEIDKIMQ